MEQNIDYLRGKNILFLAPKFFGYEIKILQKLESLGAQISFYDVRAVDSTFDKIIMKVFPFLLKNKTTKYYNKILAEIKDNQYDYVFIIKGELLNSKVLKRFKEQFYKSKFILYLYDSVSNIYGIRNIFRYFDKIYSFDKDDCSKYERLIFRPLFFGDEFREGNKKVDNIKYEYDICFIGTVHSDRYKIIKKMTQICINQNLKSYIYLYIQSKFTFIIYKILKIDFWKANIREFSFDKMSHQDIADIVSRTSVMLDIQHPNQSGLTMRTIEMIGMNKKIITTNRDIVNYDFFDPANIHVIDRKSPTIPSVFFNSNYRKIDETIYNYYDINQWITEVVN